jgi:hypothetical protein
VHLSSPAPGDLPIAIDTASTPHSPDVMNPPPIPMALFESGIKPGRLMGNAVRGVVTPAPDTANTYPSAVEAALASISATLMMDDDYQLHARHEILQNLQQQLPDSAQWRIGFAINPLQARWLAVDKSVFSATPRDSLTLWLFDLHNRDLYAHSISRNTIVVATAGLVGPCSVSLTWWQAGRYRTTLVGVFAVPKP